MAPKKRKSRLKYNKEWREANPEYAERQRAYANKRYRQRNPIQRMLDSSRQRAKKAGIEWDLTSEDIIIPEVCPIFKVSFEYGTPYSHSLDRIDNRKGYIKGNVQVIGRMANTMKSSASREELLKFADWIKETYSEPPEQEPGL